MTDTYEVITYLEVPGRQAEELDKFYLKVDYEVDDRHSFVYTRTRRIYREEDDAKA